MGNGPAFSQFLGLGVGLGVPGSDDVVVRVVMVVVVGYCSIVVVAVGMAVFVTVAFVIVAGVL